MDTIKYFFSRLNLMLRDATVPMVLTPLLDLDDDRNGETGVYYLKFERNPPIFAGKPVRIVVVTSDRGFRVPGGIMMVTRPIPYSHIKAMNEFIPESAKLIRTIEEKLSSKFDNPSEFEAELVNPRIVVLTNEEPGMWLFNAEQPRYGETYGYTAVFKGHELDDGFWGD